MYNCHNDKRLALNCKMLFFGVTCPGKSFQTFIPITLKLGEALALACSTWILFFPADLVLLGELVQNT